MSAPSPTPAIVPPYLNKHWQELRAHLRATAEQAERAASLSTLEGVHTALGLAMRELMDASFALHCLERDVTCQPLAGVDE